MLPELAMAQKLLWLAMGIPAAELLVILRKNKKKLATSKLGNKGDMGKLTGKDGLILSKKFQLTFKKTLEGTVVIAPPGEGKTTSIFLPNLLSNSLPKSSLIISDPKGELYKLTSKYQESIGRKPILFEPLGDNAKYNPLEHCSNFTEVRTIASSLLSNGELAIQLSSGKSGGSSEWVNMAIPLFTAALLQNKTIPQAVKFLINTPTVELPEILGNSKNEDVREQFNIFMSSAGSPKTLSSIVSTLLTSLQLFTDHQLINSISSNTFTPKEIKTSPVALYVKYDESKSNYLAPFLSVFYSQLIEKLMYSEGLPVIFMLDEFQNVGRITNFEQVAAVCRSREIGFLICLQNIVRLYDIYGKNNTATILNCMKSKCILPSISDLYALEYISNLCGDTQYTGETQTGDKKTYTQVVRKLYTPDEVRRIPDNKVLIVAHNKLPFLDNQNIYYKQKRYKENVINLK